MYEFSVCVALFVIVAAVTYAWVERQWRWRWREVEAGRIPSDVSSGAYRSGGDVPRFRVRAPASVRIAAFSSLLLGQLFVPLAIVGALAIMAAGVGLLAVPSLIVSAKLYRAGLSLLRRDPRLAFFRARDAALWSAWVGGFKLVLAMVTLLTWRPQDNVMGLVALLSTFELLQALLVRVVIRKWEDALFAASSQPTVSTPAAGVL